jgi:hypothetical protein
MSSIMRRSISILSGLLLLVPLPCIQSAAANFTQEPVRILFHEPNKLIVTMAPALRQAIRQYFPGYALPPISAFDPGLRKGFLMRTPPSGETPASFICVGDFDGNGLLDVALFLKNRRSRWLLVAFHQTYRGTFRPYRLARLEPLQTGFACWIMCHPPGRLQSYMVAAGAMDENEKAPAIRSKHDWIELEDEGATQNFGYYFKGGRYRSLIW